MPLIVAKFGGTSLATGIRFLHIARLVRENPFRKLVVVSAPGKRFAGDAKVTDLLLRFARLKDEEDWARVAARFSGIASAVGQDLSAALDQTRESILRFDDEAYAASRGECLAARIMARLLDFDFVDAASCVRFGPDGNLDASQTESALRAAFDPERGAVLPGFYGATPRGRICLLPRGGSDITGALAARALRASVYENWTDVDGVYDRDPADKNAQILSRLDYQRMRELCAQGACVLHADSLAPVEAAGIPVHVRNSFSPQKAGTWIESK